MKKILIFSNSLSSLYIFRAGLINDLSKDKNNKLILLSNRDYVKDINLYKRIHAANNVYFYDINLHRTSIKLF